MEPPITAVTGNPVLCFLHLVVTQSFFLRLAVLFLVLDLRLEFCLQTDDEEADDDSVDVDCDWMARVTRKAKLCFLGLRELSLRN